jgi:hypothetical protein
MPLMPILGVALLPASPNAIEPSLSFLLLSVNIIMFYTVSTCRADLSRAIGPVVSFVHSRRQSIDGNALHQQLQSFDGNALHQQRQSFSSIDSCISKLLYSQVTKSETYAFK